MITSSPRTMAPMVTPSGTTRSQPACLRPPARGAPKNRAYDFAAVAAVAGFLEDDLDPGARLAVWGHVLAPSLAGRYLTHRQRLAPAADGGLDRWLGICITDLQRGATEAVALVGGQGSGASVAAAADAVSTALERVAGT